MLTVTVAADHHRLATLAGIKAELQVTGGADDAFLSALIDRASATVRAWCSRTFALETLSETFRLSRPDDALLLSRWPVVAVTAIAEAGTTLSAADFETDTGKGLVYRLDGSDNRSRWPAGKIVVEYQAGFILPGENGRTLPEDIEKAATLLVKADYFARSRDPLLKAEDVSAVLSTSYWVGGFGDGGSLPPDVEGLLSRYRQPAMG